MAGGATATAEGDVEGAAAPHDVATAAMECLVLAAVEAMDMVGFTMVMAAEAPEAAAAVVEAAIVGKPTPEGRVATALGTTAALPPMAPVAAGAGETVVTAAAAVEIHMALLTRGMALPADKVSEGAVEMEPLVTPAVRAATVTVARRAAAGIAA